MPTGSKVLAAPGAAAPNKPRKTLPKSADTTSDGSETDPKNPKKGMLGSGAYSITAGPAKPKSA